MRNIIAIAIMFLAFLIVPREATACSCIFSDIPTSFRDATVVVVAEAISVSSTKKKTAISPLDEEYEIERQTVVWEVYESFKGPYKQQAKFTTSTEVTCCMCGMSANQGKTYVLYLHGEEPYGLSDCSGSSLLQNSLDSIPILKRLSRRTRNGT